MAVNTRMLAFNPYRLQGPSFALFSRSSRASHAPSSGHDLVQPYFVVTPINLATPRHRCFTGPPPVLPRKCCSASLDGQIAVGMRARTRHERTNNMGERFTRLNRSLNREIIVLGVLFSNYS